MMKSTLFVLSCVMLLVSATAYAQQGGTITADPNARPLRPIWQVQGNIVGGDRVGEGVGGLGDIFGTGKGAWAVLYGTLEQWRVYRHDSIDIAADTTPIQVFDNYGAIPGYPIVGDFWGTGHKAIGFARRNRDTVNGHVHFYYELHFYRTEGDEIAATESLILNTRLMIPPRQAEPDVILVADLDRDGTDELILVQAGVGLDTGVSHNPEIWIYKGGPNFQVDSPTVIIKHPLENGIGHIYAATGDFDGDGHTDIVISRGSNGGDGRNHLTFYWGTGDVNAFADTANRRIVALGSDYPSNDFGITALDCDGDGRMDLATDRTFNAPIGTYLFRSHTAKNARTRSYRIDDADIVFSGAPVHLSGGYISDSTRRFGVLALGKFESEPGDRPTLTFFSGGDDGPDLAYDAFNTYGLGKMPIPDVDGDGWDDYMGGNYAVNSNGGIAAIYAGGPYIPGPKTSGVDAIAGEGHQQAVTVWPNPVRDELHIAWRGDLQHTPRAFVVHDILGHEVTRADVQTGTGAVLWHCANVAAGTYLLSIYDSRGALITTSTIIKE